MKKIQLPAFLVKRSTRLTIISLIFVILYIAFHTSVAAEYGVLRTLSDGFFEIGLIYLVMGMYLYTYNIGLFKGFRYWGYRMTNYVHRKRNSAYDAKPMDLVEYTALIMSKPKKPTAPYLIFGVSLVSLSAIMVVLSSLVS